MDNEFEVMGIQNCCDGKLAGLFNDAVDKVLSDVAERPDEGGKRVITLKIEFSALASGQFLLACSSKTAIPEMKKSGLARIGPVSGQFEPIKAYEEPELPLEMAGSVTDISKAHKQGAGGE